MLKNNVNTIPIRKEENIKKETDFWSILINLSEMVIALIGAFIQFIFWIIFSIFILWFFITVL